MYIRDKAWRCEFQEEEIGKTGAFDLVWVFMESTTF
jgi:hypothetical protein